MMTLDTCTCGSGLDASSCCGVDTFTLGGDDVLDEAALEEVDEDDEEEGDEDEDEDEDEEDDEEEEEGKIVEW